jgi:hypothetical protein
MSLPFNQESNVLVMFPSSKNYPLEENFMESIPDYNDSRFEEETFDNDEIELDGDEVFDSLEAFMNRQKEEETITPDDRLILKINEQISAISKAQERIKFYLEELNIFMPARK